MLLLTQAVLFSFVTVVVSHNNSIYEEVEIDLNAWAKELRANFSKSLYDNDRFAYETAFAKPFKIDDNIESFLPLITYIPPSYDKPSSSGSRWSGHAKYTVVIIIPGSGLCYWFAKKRRVQRVDLGSVTVERIEREPVEPTLHPSDKESLFLHDDQDT